FSSRRRHTRFSRDWSSDVCSSDLQGRQLLLAADGVLACLGHEVPQVRGAALGRGPGEAGGTCLEAAVDAGGDDGVHRWPPSSLFVFWSALQDARQLLAEVRGGSGLRLDARL